MDAEFMGENAEIHDFCGEEIFKSAPIYHSCINYGAALRKRTPGCYGRGTPMHREQSSALTVTDPLRAKACGSRQEPIHSVFGAVLPVHAVNHLQERYCLISFLFA